MIISSPLRYPGGKARLLPLMSDIIQRNRLFGCTYREPYAGGGGLALNLLRGGFVGRIGLNDFDPAIYSFWLSAIKYGEEFKQRILNVPLTIDHWHKEKEIWENPEKYNELDLGFATFYLNRTNRSGIIDGAGPIGGYAQLGKYKIDARFNRLALAKNISYLQSMGENIEISFCDACKYIDEHVDSGDLIYLDPPYYIKGKKLYRNSYSHDDHAKIAEIVEGSRGNWMVSYDDVPAIRSIYEWAAPMLLTLDYSAGSRSVGHEVLYFSPGLARPDVCSIAA